MRESTGLRHGIRVLVVLVGLAIVATLLLTAYSAQRANRAAAERANRLDPAETIAAQLQTAYVDERDALRGYLMASDGTASPPVTPSVATPSAATPSVAASAPATQPRSGTASSPTPGAGALKPYQRALGDIAARGRDLRARLTEFPTLLAQVDAVDRAHQRWQQDSVEPEIALMGAGRTDAARARELGNDSRDQFLAIRSALTGLAGDLTGEQTEAADRVKDSSTLMLSSFGTIVVVLLALTALLFILSRRWLLVPINELRSAVNAVAAGRYDTMVPAVGPREIVDLAGNVEAMRAQLVSLVRQNERSWEALAQEGPAVLALRDALTPTLPLETAGLRLLGRVDPAEGELAGDWFDAIELATGQVAVVVGDVAGHGAQAGVFALRLKQLLTAALTRGIQPAMAVQWVVEALGDTGETFATALVVLVDPRDGEVVYTNAGHPDALVLRAAAERGALAGEVEALASTGPLMSSVVAEPEAWRVSRLRLARGDVLFVYTDGLVEARDAAGRQFGQQRLVDELIRVRERSPRQLLDDVFAAVRRHAPGRPSDDRTAIALSLAPDTRSVR